MPDLPGLDDLLRRIGELQYELLGLRQDAGAQPVIEHLDDAQSHLAGCESSLRAAAEASR